MFDSVRSRLALWHTSVLAVLLAALAVGSYLWLGRAVGLRDDRFLEESTNAFRANVAAERAEVPLDTAVQQSLSEFRIRNVTFFVYDSSDRLLGQSAVSAPSGASLRRPGDVAPSMASLHALRGERRGEAGSRFAVLVNGDDSHRLYILPVTLGAERFTIVASASLADQMELMEDTRAVFLIAIPIGLFFAWLGGYALARRSLAPVSMMSSRAQTLGATSLHERLPVENPRDELGQLAMTFNQLLERLDAAFDQQRRFMADAAHELRTPVAIMRGEADIALSQQTRSPEEYRGALEVIHAEGRRLSRIVGELFLLARADAGQQPLQRRALYLDELVSDCARAVRSLAQGRDVTLRCTMEPPVPVSAERQDAAEAIAHAYSGDEELLRSLLVNLLENAIKHAPPQTSVDVHLVSDDARHRIQVIDHGAGIPVGARKRIFERFYRADAARTRDVASETGGAGLGLAIARWVAEVHGGTLRLISAEAGRTEFELTLPRPRADVRYELVEDAGYPAAR